MMTLVSSVVSPSVPDDIAPVGGNLTGVTITASTSGSLDASPPTAAYAGDRMSMSSAEVGKHRITGTRPGFELDEAAAPVAGGGSITSDGSSSGSISLNTGESPYGSYELAAVNSSSAEPTTDHAGSGFADGSGYLGSDTLYLNGVNIPAHDPESKRTGIGYFPGPDAYSSWSSGYESPASAWATGSNMYGSASFSSDYDVYGTAITGQSTKRP